MLDIKFIRENLEEVEEGTKNKGYEVDFKKLIELDKKRVELIKKTDELRAKQKKMGKDKIEEAKKIKEELKNLEPKLIEVDRDYRNLLEQEADEAYENVINRGLY